MTNDNVISLNANSESNFISGTAFCISCNHKWVAVLESKDEEHNTWLECPLCGEQKGKFKYHFAPEGRVWTCACGNELFYIQENGIVCPNCSSVQAFPY